MPITLTVTGDSAASILHDLKMLAGGLPPSAPVSLPELLAKQGANLTQALPLLNTDGEVVGSVGPISEAVAEDITPPAQAQETTEQKRKRRGKAEMEAARVFEKYVADHGADEGRVLLSEYGIEDVADIGPDRAEHFVGRAKCGPNTEPDHPQVEHKHEDIGEDLLGDLGETTIETPVIVEPWLLKGADGNRYDAYATPKEWCESLAALITSADTVEEIKALATVNAGIRERMDAAGKLPLLQEVIDGARARMASLEAKPATTGGAPTVHDCAAALHEFLDPNNPLKLTSDERVAEAQEVLKRFNVPRVANLKPEQFADFIAAISEAGAE